MVLEEYQRKMEAYVDRLSSDESETLLSEMYSFQMKYMEAVE